MKLPEHPELSKLQRVYPDALAAHLRTEHGEQAARGYKPSFVQACERVHQTCHEREAYLEFCRRRGLDPDGYVLDAEGLPYFPADDAWREYKRTHRNRPELRVLA